MRNTLLILFCLINLISQSQISPSDGAVLNYSQLLFRINEVPDAVQYLFSIESITDHGERKGNVRQVLDSTHVTIINDFQFGKSYRWKVKALNKIDSVIYESQEYQFKLGMPISINPNIYRYSVTTNKVSSDENGIVFLDYNKVAINRNGEPVWFLPQQQTNRNERIRDLKMTSDGTITFLTKNKCAEVSLTNEVLWSTPMINSTPEDSTEYFHHEFTKLNTGNYLVIGKYFEYKVLKSGNQTFTKIPISILVEYNEMGDTAWQWSTRELIKDEDLNKMDLFTLMGNTLGHCNAVYNSNDNSKVYVSFRNLDGVIVLDKQSKKVINSYGHSVPSDDKNVPIDYFSRQHAAIPIEPDKILVFNNNHENKASSIVIFTETDPSRKIWEFKCDFDNLRPKHSDRMGNVQVMKNGNYLVNMGYASRLFEVSQNKKVVWNCLPEMWNSDSSKWVPFPNYRLNYQSSLYPKYFSLSRRRDDNGEIYYLLQNEGSDPDSYIVGISDTNNNTLNSLQVDIESDNGFRIYPSSFLTEEELQMQLTMKVTSKTNRLQKVETVIEL